MKPVSAFARNARAAVRMRRSAGLSRPISLGCAHTTVPRYLSTFESAIPPTLDVVQTDGQHTIGHMTDVEGHLPYFRRCVEHSSVLQWGGGAGESELELRDGCLFVYGGDTFDKGYGDIRVSKMLVSLKKRYPGRVFLLIGNRDVNKLKLSSELHESDIARHVDDIPRTYLNNVRAHIVRLAQRVVGTAAAYWVLDAKHQTTLRQYLTKLWRQETGATDSAEPDDATLQAMHTQKNRLLYLLNNHMGCFNTFALRRMELSQLHGVDVSTIADDDVVRSFVDSVRIPDTPDGDWGFAADYLRHAQIGVVIDHTLFVHGGTTEECIGFIPASDVCHDKRRVGIETDVPGRQVDCVHQWIQGLNQFARHGLEQWMRAPVWDAARQGRGGDSLMGYGYRPAMLGRTAMVQSYMGENQHPRVVSDEVAQFLNRSGIGRVVTGHQPWGDSPAILRERSGIEIITADTSFSDPASKEPFDTRGQAVSEVSIRPDPHAVAHGTDAIPTRAHVRGVLADGTPINFQLPTVHQVAPPSTCPLGRQTRCGWWVKAKLCEATSEGGEAQYLLSRGEGYTVHYRRESASKVAELVAGGRSRAV